MIERRRKAADGGQPSQPVYDHGQWAKAFPCLAEFLTLTTFSDQSPRVPGTITISAEDGVYKCCIRDKAEESYCYRSGKTPGDLLASVEKGLAAGTLEWRVDKPWKPTAKR